MDGPPSSLPVAVALRGTTFLGVLAGRRWHGSTLFGHIYSLCIYIFIFLCDLALVSK